MRIGLAQRAGGLVNRGLYWEWALNALWPEVETVPLLQHLGNKQWRVHPTATCDACIRVSDGGHFDLPEHWRPVYFICSATHLDGWLDNGWRKTAAQADHVFYMLPQAAEAYGGTWLPHAAHYYPDLGDERPCDLASVANLAALPLFEDRTAALKRIAEVLGEQEGASVWIGQGLTFEKMAQQYARSKVVLNWSLNQDLNMRCFEAAACGAALLTNWCPGLDTIFGDLPVVYDGVDDAIEKAKWLLANPEEWQRRGREMRKIAERHSYAHRVRAVLDRIKVDLGVTT